MEGKVGDAKTGDQGSRSGLALFQVMALNQSHETTLWASISPYVLNKKCFKSAQEQTGQKRTAEKQQKREGQPTSNE